MGLDDCERSRLITRMALDDRLDETREPFRWLSVRLDDRNDLFVRLLPTALCKQLVSKQRVRLLIARRANK